HGTSRCTIYGCGLPNCFKTSRIRNPLIFSGVCKQHEVCVPTLSENCLNWSLPFKRLTHYYLGSPFESGVQFVVEGFMFGFEIFTGFLPIAIRLLANCCPRRQLNSLQQKTINKSKLAAFSFHYWKSRVETGSYSWKANSNSLLIGICVKFLSVLIACLYFLTLFWRQRIVMTSSSGINLAPSMDALRHDEEKSNNLQNEENLRRYTNPLKGSSSSLGRVNGMELSLNPAPELATVSTLANASASSSGVHRSQPLYPESNFDCDMETSTKSKEFHTKRSSQILLHKTQNSDMKKNTVGSIDSPRKDFGKRSINCKPMPPPTATATVTTTVAVAECNDSEILTVLV
ncbi:hypothetical protein DOY81_012181, partial [Sarcophaga bullata]